MDVVRGVPAPEGHLQRMTTRDEARRRGDVRSDASRVTVTPEPPASLPERLLAARERKGVDLYRAERDTKIRARYLGALERGDYRELPGAVYTKGFLRNYALYLGLDPDDILMQWRRERGDTTAISEPVIVVPRPLTAPRPGLTFSPAIIVAAVMTVVLFAFVAYLGMQVLRFARPPTIAVSQPATAVSDVDEDTTSYMLRGTTIPRGTVNIQDAPDHTTQVSAGADGSWTQDVTLRRGRNDFTVWATDPETGKISEQKVQIIINVPFSVVQAPTLAVDSPAEGASFENGAIPIGGTATNATQVVVSATYIGPAAPAGGGAPAPSPRGPSPVTVPVGADGTFSTPFELTSGRWQIIVTASSAEGKTTAIQRSVTVAYKGVNLVVTIHGRAWLKVWVDGEVDPRVGPAGRVYNDGKVLTFTGQQTIEVRTGSSGATFFTLNGTSLGRLGQSGIPETWLFTRTGAPKLTQHQ
jgi:cytoskeletal protein RodZ